MSLSRREFGKLALAGLPAAALMETPLFGSVLAQAKPNSKFSGVQIGTITYSYRSMPDQSAEATLKYILDSGISAIELMGGPAESFAQKETGFVAPNAGRRGGAGGPGGAGAGGGRGPAPSYAPVAGMMVGPGNNQAAGQWNGQTCPAGRNGGGAPGAPAAAAGAAAAAGPGGAPGAPGGGGRGRGEMTPEQQEAAAALKKWRTSVSMDPFKKLRKMYNDAGVTIYAWKQLSTNMSDEEFEYIFNVAEALGCTHTTLELPTDEAALKRVGDFAMKKKIYAAYHTHQQGSMTVFDKAFALSPGNMANVDLGHFVAATNPAGSPIDFLNKFHDRISSFHLKDRTTVAHCALNLAWGTGETPVKEILRLVRDKKWTMPASIELEYEVPQGSDAVIETKKCVEYCKAALMA
jgi:sugar phosphate isomerase/epimerase